MSTGNTKYGNRNREKGDRKEGEAEKKGKQEEGEAGRGGKR